MNEIQTSQEWSEALEQSKETPQFIMKHSSTCPISATAFQAFRAVETDVPKQYLVVQQSRALSNEIEAELGIRHESPQLFLLKDGGAVWNASHYDISESKIKQALQEYC
ncbi:bacillithiol system redox-active protein YtxJ [Sporosarcina sp. 179-K 3D1 HS]|uniref:bacillithiol system redox-active protein YtxJ n=1 Tax=Sporosarcina sp. 179-K 3D1 HS TaxID=3232169 RepID=UPI0039A1F5A2